MTDLNAESEILPVEDAREEWKGHKVRKQIYKSFFRYNLCAMIIIFLTDKVQGQEIRYPLVFRIRTR